MIALLNHPPTWTLLFLVAMAALASCYRGGR